MPAQSNGRANLHLHTVHSDGELSPEDLVEAHARAGFTAIALTDHDTLAGIDALGDPGRFGVRVVPGVELSIEDEPARGLVDVHILGYGFDLGHAPLRARLRVASQEREAQKRETVRRLKESGFRIEWESVRARAQGNVGRPHIVAAIEAAHPGQEREQLYALMGPQGPAYVPRARELPPRRGGLKTDDTGHLDSHDGLHVLCDVQPDDALRRDLHTRRWSLVEHCPHRFARPYEP